MKYLYRISLIFMILTITSALVLGVYFFTRQIKQKKMTVKRKKRI